LSAERFLQSGWSRFFFAAIGKRPEDSTSYCCSGLAVALREISFGGGALALAASLTGQWRERATRIQAAIARYFVAIRVLFFQLSSNSCTAITFPEFH
jgi:hypothetical protein